MEKRIKPENPKKGLEKGKAQKAFSFWKNSKKQTKSGICKKDTKMKIDSKKN